MSGPASMTVAQRRLGAVEVRDQDLDAHAGAAIAELADRRRERAGPAVGQVVAGDRGDHDVLEAHLRDRLGDAPRLVVVEPGGLAGLDRAEAAGAGADVAQDHDRRGPLVPAVPDVGAAGLLADRVEVQAAQEALEVVVVVARRHPRLDPVGVAAERDRAVSGRAERAAAHRDRDLARRRRVAGPASGRTSGARGPWVECRSRPVSRTCRGGPARASRGAKPSSSAALSTVAQ